MVAEFDGLGVGLQFEDDELVAARVPERAGGVEGALRPLVGVAAEQEAVEPEQSAAPAGQGDEGVGGGVEGGGNSGCSAG